MAADDNETLLTSHATKTGHGRAGAQPIEQVELSPGGRIEQFELIEPLGEGGMGVVMRAVDTTLRRDVAVKVMRRGPGEQENVRLLREARAMARLSHPNVVAVYQAGTVAGQVYVAMELAGKRTLGDWMDEAGHRWQDVVDLFVQAGRGLAAAHAAGLVHRDFKPRNVLLDDAGVARVSDFGLVTAGEAAPAESSMDAPGASLPGGITRTGQAVGTPRYMSPEQHECAPVDARSDQFSFCVALFEALYGRPPFPGKTYQAIAARVVLGELDPPPEDARVPRWLQRIVLRGLATKPADRFPSMTGLLHALERGRHARRRLAIASAAGVVAIAAGALLVFTGGHAPEVCANAAAELEQAWSNPRRDRVRQAFDRSGAPDAATRYKTLEHTLNGYTESWVRSHREACRATRVHGHQSSEVLQVRMMCLEQRRRELGAFTELLARADAALVKRATVAAQGLPPVAACDDVAALSAVVPPPATTDTTTLDGIARARQALAEVTALTSAGLHITAMPKAEALVRDARALGYAPVLAEALAQLGFLQDSTGKLEAAATSYREAVRAADSGRHDEVRITALTALARLYGATLHRAAEGKQYVRDARAVLARLGKRPQLEAQLLRIEGGISVLDGKHARALELHQQAMAAFGDGDKQSSAYAHILEGTAQALLWLRRYAEAKQRQEQALAIFELVHGAEHMAVAGAREHLGVIQFRLGDRTAGLASIAKALTLKRKLLPANHPKLAYGYLSLAMLQEEAKQHREALDYYQRGVEIFVSQYGARHYLVGRTLVQIGRLLLKARRPADAAVALDRALPVLTAAEATKPGELARARFYLAQALRKLDQKPRSCALAHQARAEWLRIGERASADMVTKWVGKDCPLPK